VELFQLALARRGFRTARLVRWLDFLRNPAILSRELAPGTLLRIESPGRDWEVERALLRAGSTEPDDGFYLRLSAEQVDRLEFEKGRIHALRQWYLGFRAALRSIERALGAAPCVQVFSAPDAISAMFDKPAGQQRLGTAGIPVPAPVGSDLRGYDDLIAGMERAGARQVFVKPAHGSSASGVVAYRTDGRRHFAVTTVELQRVGPEVRLYNSRRLRVLRGQAEIAGTIDAVCRHRAYAERWVPKAGIDGDTFDLRVVVIGGELRHVVPRLSRSPITNLHLLNRRGDAAAVRGRFRDEDWQALSLTCRAAPAAFPGAGYAGLDVAVTADFRRHAVLEVNAFGDLLPGASMAGEDTYGWEVRELVLPALGVGSCLMPAR
jgi:hypothetical protein